MVLQGRRHSAHVHANGRIKDSKGKVHAALEHWLESIAGNNIPVSSAYAWSKVGLYHTTAPSRSGGEKRGK